MARISGIVLPNNKQVATALTYIHGIGATASQKIVSQAKITPDKRVKDLQDQEIQAIQQIINDQFIVEGDLRRLVFGNVKRLKTIKAYRGLRHASNLPVRGQQTRTNARTKRGRKVTVGGTTRKAPSKT